MSDEPEELSIKPISLWPLRDATVNYFLGFFSFYFSQCFFQVKIWCNLTCFRDDKTRFVIPIYHINTWNNCSLTTSCVSSWVPRQRTKTSPNLGSSDLVLCCWGSSVVCSESNLKWQHFPNKQRLLFFVVFKQHNRLKDGPEFLSFMLTILYFFSEKQIIIHVLSTLQWNICVTGPLLFHGQICMVFESHCTAFMEIYLSQASAVSFFGSPPRFVCAFWSSSKALFICFIVFLSRDIY